VNAEFGIAMAAILAAFGGLVTSVAAAVVLLRRVKVVHDLVNSDMTIALQDALTAKRMLRANLAATLALKQHNGLVVETLEQEQLVTVDAEISERERALASRIKQQAAVIMDAAPPLGGVT